MTRTNARKDKVSFSEDDPDLMNDSEDSIASATAEEQTFQKRISRLGTTSDDADDVDMDDTGNASDAPSDDADN